jgi:hypothetical protein
MRQLSRQRNQPGRACPLPPPRAARPPRRVRGAAPSRESPGRRSVARRVGSAPTSRHPRAMSDAAGTGPVACSLGVHAVRQRQTTVPEGGVQHPAAPRTDPGVVPPVRDPPCAAGRRACGTPRGDPRRSPCAFSIGSAAYRPAETGAAQR